MNLILFHLICICNVVVFIVYSVNVETLLLKDILDNRDYNKYMRTPTVNKSEPIQVEIEIALNTIHSLDMKNQILTTSFGIKMSWTDEFLTWNKSDYGETNAITAPISKIWTPDVLLTNYADKSNIFEDNDKRVYIYSNGLVERRDDIEVKTYCVVNPTRYPFETETCTLNFRAQNLDNKEQMLSIGLPANFLNLFKSNGICSPCCSENEDDIGITELKYVKSQEESIHHQGSNPENVCFSGIEEDRQETELKYVQSQENPTNQPGTSQEHVDDIVILIEDKKNRKKEDNLDETKKNEIKKKRRKQKASKYDKICYVLMLLAYGSVYTFFCYKLFVERENENVA
ncbi:neuronal acetylcholine receptor subunit beta-4-like isoform X11 [Mytilus californianus]|uniref:neuronal acetylcholine receptor subunit beta-4-like isoform X11 n=1 Tax=Mytilus californianus TaxID=6549 RepID=UPI0022486326|nr:neuronal acetylcholine receptor subunit beta-4-like isoform X11 [Mytilus californianus]